MSSYGYDDFTIIEPKRSGQFTAEQLADQFASGGKFIIGKADSDFQMFVEVKPERNTFNIEHRRHDEAWAEKLNEVADTYSWEKALEMVRDNPTNYASLPASKRWDDIWSFLAHGEEVYYDVFSQRDDDVNGRGNDIRETPVDRGLRDVEGAAGDDDYIEFINDFEQAASEGFPNELGLKEFDSHALEREMQFGLQMQRQKQLEKLREEFKAQSKHDRSFRQPRGSRRRF